MAKRNQPGVITQFNGLWKRGPIELTPSDHFSDCSNVQYGTEGVQSRDGSSTYNDQTNIVREHLYKPYPPYSGTNVPRLITLDSSGNLYDYLISSSPLYTNTDAKDFSLVNFFGRCYISFSDGKVGIPTSSDSTYVYDGTGPGSGFRLAAGAQPGTPLVAVWSTATPGYIDVGTFLVSYAFETVSGFITQPAAPFVGFDSFGGGTLNITTLPTGGPEVAARWIIITQVSPLGGILGPVGGPWNVGLAANMPLYFLTRIGNNTDTSAYGINFNNLQLINDATYTYNQMTSIPCGVGMLDYNGRLVTYGVSSDPTLVYVSEPGQPEAISATSGFIITDPTDGSGVRNGVVYLNNLYLYKRQRGLITTDNGGEASTWQTTNFDKAYGTETYGIASVLDAIGSSPEGFVIATLGGLYFFNGMFVEPELSYKIRDLWLKINPKYFHLVQTVLDPVNKRIYILVPLNASTVTNAVLFADYREGLNPTSIKWSYWTFSLGITSMIAYTDYTSGTPTLVTRYATRNDVIYTLNVGTPGEDGSYAVSNSISLAPVRFGAGLSQYNRIRLRAVSTVSGTPVTLSFTLNDQDYTISSSAANLTISNDVPGREYAQLANFITENMILNIFNSGTSGQAFAINAIVIEGAPVFDERPR